MSAATGTREWMPNSRNRCDEDCPESMECPDCHGTGGQA